MRALRAGLCIALVMGLAGCGDAVPERTSAQSNALSFSEQTKLQPSMFDENLFGYALAIEGQTLLAGAPSAPGGARVYVYDALSPASPPSQELVPPGASTGLEGMALAIDGDRFVLGDSWASPRGSQSGAAHVYRHDGSQWVLEQSLVPSDNVAWDGFGQSVAIDGDTIAVGGYKHDEAYNDAGAVWVFRFDGSSWQQDARILPTDDPDYQDYFGISVALEGTTLVVGSYKRVVPSSTGAAYVYERDASQTWKLDERLYVDSIRYFSENLILRNGNLLVGAPSSNNFVDVGQVFLYRKVDDSWQLRNSITSDEPNALYFGDWVDFDGTTVAVGSIEPPMGYLYTLSGDTFTPAGKLPPWDKPPSQYGVMIAVSGGTVAVGAPNYADQPSTTFGPGAAYVFRDPNVPPTGGTGGTAGSGTGAAGGSAGSSGAGGTSGNPAATSSSSSDEHSLYGCALSPHRTRSHWSLLSLGLLALAGYRRRRARP